jgi:pteridine reductase
MSVDKMATTEPKVALVTGAAKRIGAEIARTLHYEGYFVVIHYRHSESEAKQLQTELELKRSNSTLLVKEDLLNIANLPLMVSHILQQTIRLDILVNNASSFYPTLMGSITEQQFDDLIGSNLKAPLFLSQACAPALQQTNGCIINIVDIHGQRPLKGYPAYSVAKAGLHMLTQSLARELGPHIRVNGVAPGAILWPEHADNTQMHVNLIAKTALKNEGSPQDIAKTVLFLAKDAPYITGQIIAVDGGRLLNH